MYCSVILYIFNLSFGKCIFFLVCYFLVRMKLKEINRTAIQSWSPSQQHPIYLATGRSTLPRHETIRKLLQTRPIWRRAQVNPTQIFTFLFLFIKQRESGPFIASFFKTSLWSFFSRDLRTAAGCLLQHQCLPGDLWVGLGRYVSGHEVLWHLLVLSQVGRQATDIQGGNHTLLYCWTA